MRLRPARSMPLAAATLSIAAALLPACSGSGFRAGLETRSSLLAGSLSPREVLASRPPRCATLPASGPSNFAPVIDAALSAAIDQRLPDATVVDAGRLGNLLNEVDFVTRLLAMLSTYSTTGILDGATLREFGRLTDAEFVLLPSLVLVDRNEQARFTFFGAVLLFSSWTRVQATLQLWRVEDATLLWQSVGGGSIDSETPAGTPVSLHDTLQQVFMAMLDDLLLGRDRSVASFDLPRPAATPPPPSPATAPSPPDRSRSLPPAGPEPDRHEPSDLGEIEQGRAVRGRG